MDSVGLQPRCRTALHTWCKFDCLDSLYEVSADVKHWHCAAKSGELHTCKSPEIDQHRPKRQRDGLQARLSACMSNAKNVSACVLSCASHATVSHDPLHCQQSLLPAAVETDAVVASYHRIAFALLIRDAARFIETSVEKLVELGAAFRERRIYYVENDSTDETRAILARLTARHDGILHGAMLDNVSAASSLYLCPFKVMNCKQRTSLLGRLRQRVLDMALAWREADAVVVVDADFTTVSVPDFVRAFATGARHKAAAVFARSVYLSSLGWEATYDVSAIELVGKQGFARGFFTRAKKSTKQLRYERQQLSSSRCLLEVQSGFGGFGIYWASALRDARPDYSSLPKDNGRSELPEHVAFNRKLHAFWRGRRPMFIDTRFKPRYGWGDDEGYWLRQEEGVLKMWNTGRGRSVAKMWSDAGKRFPLEPRSNQQNMCGRVEAALGELQICRAARAFEPLPSFSEIPNKAAAQARASRWLTHLRAQGLVPTASAMGELEGQVMSKYLEEWGRILYRRYVSNRPHLSKMRAVRASTKEPLSF